MLTTDQRDALECAYVEAFMEWLHLPADDPRYTELWQRMDAINAQLHAGVSDDPQ